MPRRERRRAGTGLMVFLLVFVGLAAAFMAAVVFSDDVDLVNRLIAIGILIPLIVWVVALSSGLRRALFGRWMSDLRWRRFRHELEDAGFREATSEETDHAGRLPIHALHPAVLAAHRGGGVDHVWMGRIGRQEARAFNIRMRGGGWRDDLAVAVRTDASLAPTMIVPVRAIPLLPPRPEMKPVRFELETFNREMGVFSSDIRFASAMLDARMIDWLMVECPRVVIEMADRWVVARVMPRSGRHLRPTDLIDVIVGFDAHIPRAVPGLFPTGQDQLLWRA